MSLELSMEHPSSEELRDQQDHRELSGRPRSTRRNFLQLVGAAGGGSAVYASMAAMGLIRSPVKAAERPDLPANSGEGTTVAILGAGMAGLVAAYELSKAGYQCKILEARDRVGGRNWTIRGGDTIAELTGTTQTCEFDSDPQLYLNPGPARIPYHHTATLDYCREFGVPMEVVVNDNRGAVFHNEEAFDGEPILNRRVVNDSRGYIAELLAKAISQDALDEEISSLDKETLVEFVKRFGDLDDELLYTGSSRSGYATPPGAGAASGEAYDPIDLSELLKSDFWGYKMHFGEGSHQAATMLQPVGGMDQIAHAFERRIKGLIQYNAEVSEIRKTEDGVQIVYTDKVTGEETALSASYAICTLPLSVLAQLDTDLSPEVTEAVEVGAGSYARAAKIGFASPRFWETEQQIYGGISWTDQDITQIWYPSTAYMSPNGILVGAYIWDDEIGEAFAEMSLEERLQMGIQQGEQIHPGYGDFVSKGISISWPQIPYSQGAWMEWSDEALEGAYSTLIDQPDDRIYLAGEHLSYLTGWQEGAVLSAFQAVEAISKQLMAQNS